MLFSHSARENARQDRAYGLMKQYRMKVEALYAPDSTEVLTLPRRELESNELRGTPGPDPSAIPGPVVVEKPQ